jgi:hypothetical protein
MRQETRSERSVKHGDELRGKRESANVNESVSVKENENASENVHMSGSVKRGERKDADEKSVIVRTRMKRSHVGNSATITALTKRKNHLHKRTKSLRKQLLRSFFGRVKWSPDHVNDPSMKRTKHWNL